MFEGVPSPVLQAQVLRFRIPMERLLLVLKLDGKAESGI